MNKIILFHGISNKDVVPTYGLHGLELDLAIRKLVNYNANHMFS